MRPERCGAIVDSTMREFHELFKQSDSISIPRMKQYILEGKSNIRSIDGVFRRDYKLHVIGTIHKNSFIITVHSIGGEFTKYMSIDFISDHFDLKLNEEGNYQNQYMTVYPSTLAKLINYVMEHRSEYNITQTSVEEVCW